MTMSNETAS